MDGAAPTDEQLMLDYLAGQVAAFETLYTRHERALHRYVHRLLGPRLAVHADEVVQDAWIRLIDAKEQWRVRSDARFKTWLFTLAHHRAVDVLRQSGREVSVDAIGLNPDSDQVEADPWQHWPAPSAQEPEQQSFWRAAGRQLLDCLDKLPAAQRAAFLLHYEDELALADMAQALNIEFETVKSRLRYALQKLRQCMGAHLAALHSSAPGATL